MKSFPNNNEWVFVKYLRIYDQARTAHLERLALSAGDVSMLYRRESYDFDQQLKNRLPASRASRLQIAWQLLVNRFDIVELDEPLYLDALKSTGLYLLILSFKRKIMGTRVRIVSYAIENLGLDERRFSSRHLPRYMAGLPSRLLFHFVLRHYDRIAYGSQVARDAYRRSWARVPSCDSQIFEALEPPCASCRTDRKTLSVIFVGDFSERKGVTSLMRAWPLVVKAIPEARLRLIGKGALADIVQRWADHQSSVSVTIDPPHSVIHAGMAEAKVLVLASQILDNWKEQIGLPIIEGLSHGCEIVASSSTGLSAWLRQHDHRVVEPGCSARILAKALISALHSKKDPQAILGSLPNDSGRELATAWFSQEDAMSA